MISPLERDLYIDNFMEQLAARFNTLWWPKYLFHYSDITNIVKILESGHLYSRAFAGKHNLMQMDSAAHDIISQTRPELLDCVRLYFRPRTPPLFRVEGFQPAGNRNSALGAHCPIPIYLLFDSKRILSNESTKFSDGNLGSSMSNICDDIRDLENLEFDFIYHDTYLPGDNPEYKARIIKKRCTEVIVPSQISLDDNLKCVICRSYAERETLLNLINSANRKKYSPIVRVNSQCFFRNGHYIESVVLQPKKIEIKFSNSQNPDVFQYKYVFGFKNNEVIKEFNRPISIFSLTDPLSAYALAIYIDSHIAYKGNYKLMSSPFQ